MMFGKDMAGKKEKENEENDRQQSAGNVKTPCQRRTRTLRINCRAIVAKIVSNVTAVAVKKYMHTHIYTYTFSRHEERERTILLMSYCSLESGHAKGR